MADLMREAVVVLAVVASLLATATVIAVALSV
jgi:hypothetical protein